MQSCCDNCGGAVHCNESTGTYHCVECGRRQDDIRALGVDEDDYALAFGYSQAVGTSRASQPITRTSVRVNAALQSQKIGTGEDSYLETSRKRAFKETKTTFNLSAFLLLEMQKFLKTMASTLNEKFNRPICETAKKVIAKN